MKNIWFEPLRHCSTLSGSMDVLANLRGFYPRLFTWFAFGEAPGSLCGLSKASDRSLGFAVLSCPASASAKRMDVNSRGRPPTEKRPKAFLALEGPNKQSSDGVIRPRGKVRPFQGPMNFRRSSVGFTHGYSRCSPSANHHGMASLRRRWPSTNHHRLGAAPVLLLFGESSPASRLPV